MPDLPNVACPALVLAGAHDKLRPPDFVRGLCGRHPGMRNTREIDSGHVMPVQAPDAMTVAMLAFYARIGSI